MQGNMTDIKHLVCKCAVSSQQLHEMGAVTMKQPRIPMLQSALHST